MIEEAQHPDSPLTQRNSIYESNNIQNNQFLMQY